MTNVRELIRRLKEVREEKGLSYSDILDLMEKNGDYIAKSTLSRVFAEGSEDLSFKYEETILPIANALLDIETIEATDDMDTQAMKVLLKYKIDRIKELEAELDRVKVKYHEKLDKQREDTQTKIGFLMKQIELKDKRMDMLLESIFEKDRQQKGLIEKIMKCPYGNKDILQ